MLSKPLTLALDLMHLCVGFLVVPWYPTTYLVCCARSGSPRPSRAHPPSDTLCARCAPSQLPGPPITHTCLTGLPGTPRAVSCPGETRGVLYPHGYGSCHCLQQCARFRFQHRVRHSSEHYHRRKCACQQSRRAAANPRPTPFIYQCARNRHQAVMQCLDCFFFSFS